MMLVPKKREWDLFDDFFDDSFMSDYKLMKTDIKEHDKNYELIIDLPGFDKKDINIYVENGYLNINAKTNSSNENEEKGKYLRRERYEGEFSRSFFIGEEISDDEINASFKNGILSIFVPKFEKKVENKKYIDIND